MKKQITTGALILSLTANVYLVFDYLIKKEVDCNKYYEQAMNRVNDHYAAGDTDGSLDRIFYSQKEKACIAAWQNTVVNENGLFTSYAVFNASTNKEIYSSTSNEAGTDQAYQAMNRYEGYLKESE